jgi:hypothetical protein
MKRLSDFKDEEAIDLWADLLDPIVAITSDPKIAEIKRSGAPVIKIAKEILLLHKAEAVEILLRIDPTPITGLNLVARVVDILLELESSPELQGFLGLSEPETKNEGSSGSVTGNIKEGAK